MHRYVVAIGLCILMAGAIVGHAMTGPAPVITAIETSVVSPFELMLKAKGLPVESADAV